MCKADLTKVSSFLKEHLNEPKSLSEWYYEINSVLPRCRKLTQRELAFAFKVLKHRDNFIVENDNKGYCFMIG